MNIEKQNVCLELAKQLKEARYPQGKSIFVWVDYGVGNPNRDQHEHKLFYRPDFEALINKAGMTPYFVVNKLDAPTVAELGEKLPHTIENHYELMIGTCNGKWIVCYDSDFHAWHGKIIEADTEADARAKMWLYLKKKGLIK